MDYRKTVMLLATFSFLTFACSVDKEESGEMPEVEMDVEDGNIPEYDVDWANVEVSTREKKVKVPKVIMVMEETEVDIPYINISSPGMDESREKTIKVEVEVSEYKRELDIEEVYMSENNLYVISELEDEGEDLGDNTVRVSDRIIVSLPKTEDLNVKHFILGNKPQNNFNSNHNFINNKSQIEQEIKNAKQII